MQSDLRFFLFCFSLTILFFRVVRFFSFLSNVKFISFIVSEKLKSFLTIFTKNEYYFKYRSKSSNPTFIKNLVCFNKINYHFQILYMTLPSIRDFGIRPKLLESKDSSLLSPKTQKYPSGTWTSHPCIFIVCPYNPQILLHNTIPGLKGD